MSTQPQNALNKTPDELSKLSDNRLSQVLKSARKASAKSDRAVSVASEDAKYQIIRANEDVAEAQKIADNASDYLSIVLTACEGRPHFEK